MPTNSRPLDSWDIVKLIALALMFIDHAGAFVFTDPTQTYWLRAIGRGAAPIFLFLAGYAASYRFSREIFLLGVLMAISDFVLTGTLRCQNILFLILFSRWIFHQFEKRGKFISKPYDWYLASVLLFPTMYLVDYGSMGFIFALCGYVKRHSQHYPKAMPRNLLLWAFAFYGSYEYYFSDPELGLIPMAITLALVFWVLNSLQIHEIKAPRCPLFVKRSAQWVARYSGYIYAFHDIALEWITKIPF